MNCSFSMPNSPRSSVAPHRPHPRAALLALLLTTAGLAVQAHDIVLVPQADGWRVRYGHPQDWLPVDGEKLLALQIFNGSAPPLDPHDALRRQGLDLLLTGPRQPPGDGLVAASYDNGLWARLPANPALPGTKPSYRNTSRWLAPGADDTLVSLKFAKGWRGVGASARAASVASADNPAWRREVGHLLELVPQLDPLTLKPGALLPVKVLLNGLPLAGAGVELSDLVTKLPEDRITRYTTDANGIAQVPLRPHGVQMLGVDLERPNDGSLAEGARSLPVDKLLIVATYTFVRP